MCGTTGRSFAAGRAPPCAVNRFFDFCKATRHLPEKSGKIRHLWGKATERNLEFWESALDFP
jgi:hypothetical protein